jgi:hypothetical protein
MVTMGKRWRKWLGGICWDMGDTFFGWWLKLSPPDDTWISIDIHSKCQPKPQSLFTITSSTVPTYTTGTSTTAFAKAVKVDPSGGVGVRPKHHA